MSDYSGMAWNAEELAEKRRRGGARAHEMSERGRKGASARWHTVDSYCPKRAYSSERVRPWEL